MNRRQFFGRASAVAATAMLPARALVALLPAIPILYGDGVTDDTVALRAWGDGREVIDRHGRPVVDLDGYRFSLRETLTITANKHNVVIRNCWFDTAPSFRHETMVQLDSGARKWL